MSAFRLVQIVFHCHFGVVSSLATKDVILQGDTLAAARLTDGMWRVQRHLRVTAFALKHIESATFHAVSEAFPIIPGLQVRIYWK